jgi:glycosyltransferase domain-containing protein
MLGIAIPTFNRPEFLLRQFKYYAETRFRYTIYIGDSSGPGYAEQVAEIVARFQNSINIVLIRYPGLDRVQATTALMHAIKEPYAGLIGDDDFLVPAALDQCAAFLETHPDFNTAHGVAAACAVKPAGPHHQEIMGVDGFFQRPLEQASAAERLNDYLGNYFVTHFSLHRTQDFAKEMDATKKAACQRFGELISGCLSVVGGKAKQFDCLGLVRQDHGRRYVLSDVFDWITTDDWLASCRIFQDSLAGEVAQQDGISIEESRGAVKKALWAYLARSLTAKWQGIYQGRDTGLMGRARRVKRAVPVARKAWNIWMNLRAAGTPRNTMISLPALLRPSSRYHSDFMPVYRAIISPSRFQQSLGSGSQLLPNLS